MNHELRFIYFLFCFWVTISGCIVYQEKPLSILFVLDKFPYEPRKYIDNQIVDLLDQGHQVYVLADRIGQHFSYDLSEKYDFIGRTFYKGYLPEYLNQVDIIYCQFGGRGNQALKMIKKGLIKGKLVVCFRGGDATKKFIESPHMYDELFKKADLFFPVCAHFKNILINHGCDENKIRVLYSSVDSNKIPYKERRTPAKNESIKIINVARLMEYKGIEDSIKAVAKVIKIYPNVLYEIIGEGEEMVRLSSLIKDLGLTHKIKLLGYLSFDQILEKLKESHLFLFTPFTPSYGEQEGIPNAIKEAMLVGLPVVATRHGGIPELVQDGFSGFLVAEKDINAITEKLIYLIKNPRKWGTMGKIGSDYVRNTFNKDIISQKLISFFRNIMDGEKSAEMQVSS